MKKIYCLPLMAILSLSSPIMALATDANTNQNTNTTTGGSVDNSGNSSSSSGAAVIGSGNSSNSNQNHTNVNAGNNNGNNGSNNGNNGSSNGNNGNNGNNTAIVNVAPIVNNSASNAAVNSSVNPTNNSSTTVVLPSTQVPYMNGNSGGGTNFNSALTSMGNGVANCTGPSANLGASEQMNGAGYNLGYGNLNSTNIYANLNIPLNGNNQAQCRTYQNIVVVHAQMENCNFFLKSFPGIEPKKIKGFEYCQALYIAPVVSTSPLQVKRNQ